MQTKRVLIVGGGSAGWTTAAYLNAALNIGDQKVAEISLIESPDIPRIGVGEATIPNIHHTLSVIGINELDFMKAVDGTFKQSIRYVNWLEKSKFYHHPFCRYGSGANDIVSRKWLMSNRSVPFINSVSVQGIICEMGLSPKMLDHQDSGIPLTYAYHMDALKFADYLRDHSTVRGVSHYQDHVTDVEVALNGDIKAIHTKGGKRLEADLFIDCTGFASVLSEKKLGVKWIDCSQWLICDRAITMNVPYEHHYSGSVRPYTMASAVSNGWIWDIPLQTRRSLGYVHSSAHISADDAEKELRAFEGIHCDTLSTSIVNFKVGRREHQWHRNCVTIGLSGGFIEPLESTGLYLAQVASTLLAEHFPTGDDMAPFAFRFNRLMTNRFYEILDFINMHYCLTRREDTEFWREIRRPERLNDRLRAKLEYWRIKPPSVSDFTDQYFPGQVETSLSGAGNQFTDYRPPIDSGALWNHHSYENILYGMDFLRDECRQWYGENRPRPSILKEVLDAINMAPGKLPPHDIWLKHMAGMQDYRVK